MVSKYGIRIDPLKIAAILDLPAPTNLLELQSLQGKEKFLFLFMCNFTEKTHGYMRLLNKNTPFFWDDQAQCTFDNLKHALTHSLVIHPLDYSKDFLLYIALIVIMFSTFLLQGVLPPFTHLGHVAEIFKPLGVSLGGSLESRLSPCS